TSGSTSAVGAAVFDRVTISPAVANVGPSVNAGVDGSVNLPAAATLDGTVSDDGKPIALVTSWTKVSGPGDVTFGNPSLVDTTANLSAAGSYVLRLIANDGEVKTFDDVAIAASGLAPIEQWRQTHFGGNAGDLSIAGDN